MQREPLKNKRLEKWFRSGSRGTRTAVGPTITAVSLMPPHWPANDAGVRTGETAIHDRDAGIWLVQLGGLEPPTSCSTDRRSNQLSYNCILGQP
jgi:hypothetical protein